MSGMANPKRINLDDLLGEDEPVLTKPITLFGREWDVICGLNFFTLSAIGAGEPGAVAQFLRNTVVPDQRDAFATAMSAAANLDAEKLGKIVNALVEVASERPTTQPSVSSRPASKRTSAPRSVARSS